MIQSINTHIFFSACGCKVFWCPLVPSAPVEVVADNIRPTSMTIYWQPPHNANCTISNYQVSCTPLGKSGPIYDIAGDITSTELTSLKPHTKYTIRARAGTVEFRDYSIPITETTRQDGNCKYVTVMIFSLACTCSHEWHRTQC